MGNDTNKKRVNAIDVMIILLLVLGIAGIALRFFMVKNAPDDFELPDVESKKYYVSYITRYHRYSVSEYLKENTEFRFFNSNKPFGTAYGKLDIKNALMRYFALNGEYISVYNMCDDDRAAKFDIQGTFLVEGKMDEANGVLIPLEDPDNSLALNKEVQLRSDNLVISVVVTKITEAVS